MALNDRMCEFKLHFIMQCKDNLRLILKLIQLGVFFTIFIFQIILGTSYDGVNEWFRTIWCLIFAVVILTAHWVEALQKWFPYSIVTWKLSLAIAFASVFGFRTYFIDVRTILAWSLMGVSIVFFVIGLISPEEPNSEKFEQPQYGQPGQKNGSFEFQNGVEGEQGQVEN